MRFADLPETFRSLAERTGVPGAQLTLHRAGETVTVTCGRPALTGAATVGPRTMFPLGSVTKTFTATVAVQLVADGDAEFDAPLSEYLGELAGARSRALREVTLRQALSHTGGVISDFELGTEGPVSPRGTCRRCWTARTCGGRVPRSPTPTPGTCSPGTWWSG